MIFILFSYTSNTKTSKKHLLLFSFLLDSLCGIADNTRKDGLTLAELNPRGSTMTQKPKGTISYLKSAMQLHWFYNDSSDHSLVDTSGSTACYLGPFPFDHRSFWNLQCEPSFSGASSCVFFTLTQNQFGFCFTFSC